MPYVWVGSKYAFEVCWNPWSLWSCNSVATFFFFHVAKRMLSNAKFTVCCELVLQATMLLSYKSRIIERDSIPCLVWMQEISVTHLWLGPSAWKSPFRRSPYLCSCRPGCCHFLCCRISNSKFAFLMIRRMVLGCFSFLSTSTSGDNHKWCPNIAYAARQWDRPVFYLSLACLHGEQNHNNCCGDTKESAHDSYWIFCPIPVHYLVFKFAPHFLSLDYKKRNSSFSVFNLLFSYLYSANVLAAFLPRCLGMTFSCLCRAR